MQQARSSFLSGIPNVCKNILIINLIVWLAQMVLMQRGINLSDHLGLYYFESPNFRVYQFVTSMFLHDNRSFTHLFFNMFAVFMFGRVLEQVWGSKRFLTYYFITGIGAGLIHMLVMYLLNDSIFNIPAIGASGAVFGILLGFGMLFPNTPLYIIPFPFPIKAKWLVIGYGAMELALGLAFLPGDNVAHFAHLGGMVFGIFMILYWKKKDKKKNTNHAQYFR